VAKVAAATQIFGIPVVGEFDLRVMVARGGQIDQGESTGRDIKLAYQLQSERIAIKVQGGVNVANADHRVKIFHGVRISSKTSIVMTAAPTVSARGLADQAVR
jgi:hypothetical protein